jgi:hypothetical protein
MKILKFTHSLHRRWNQRMVACSLVSILHQGTVNTAINTPLEPSLLEAPGATLRDEPVVKRPYVRPIPQYKPRVVKPVS